MSDLKTSRIIEWNGKIMYPPRPKRKIPPETINDYESLGFFGQLKFNGTRTLIELSEGNINLWTRHKEPHKAYSMSSNMEKDLQSLYDGLGSDLDHVIDGELMHSKTKGLKDKIIVFDLLVYEGNYLIGVPWIQRYRLLCEAMGDPSEREIETGREIALYYKDHLWLAETFALNLSGVFHSRVDMDEIEGLVLKNPDGELDHGFSESNNEKWQIRCRKEQKSYRY